MRFLLFVCLSFGGSVLYSMKQSLNEGYEDQGVLYLRKLSNLGKNYHIEFLRRSVPVSNNNFTYSNKRSLTPKIFNAYTQLFDLLALEKKDTLKNERAYKEDSNHQLTFTFYEQSKIGNFRKFILRNLGQIAIVGDSNSGEKFINDVGIPKEMISSVSTQGVAPNLRSKFKLIDNVKKVYPSPELYSQQEETLHNLNALISLSFKNRIKPIGTTKQSWLQKIKNFFDFGNKQPLFTKEKRGFFEMRAAQAQKKFPQFNNTFVKPFSNRFA